MLSDKRQYDALDAAWNEVEKARAAYNKALDIISALPVKLDTLELRKVRESLAETELFFRTDQRIISDYRREMQ